MISLVDHDAIQADFTDYVDGELGAARRAEVQAHVGECAECKEALETFKSTVAGLRSLSAPPPAEDILTSVQSKIRKRSRGRYFRRGFALQGYRFPYELVALLMLLLLLVVYFGMTTLKDLGPVSRTNAGERSSSER